MPAVASCAATSRISPLRTYPSTTRSLKKSARGLSGLISRACRLVGENTSICDSTGMSRAWSADCRYPPRPSSVRRMRPVLQFLVDGNDGIVERRRPVLDRHVLGRSEEHPAALSAQ